MYTVLEATHLSANKNKFRGVYYKRVHAVYDSRIIESKPKFHYSYIYIPAKTSTSLYDFHNTKPFLQMLIIINTRVNFT